MTYIDFSPYYKHNTDHWVRSKWVDEVRTWLEEHAGEEVHTWTWSRGDLLAHGVHIKDPEVALMFRLRFEV